MSKKKEKEKEIKFKENYRFDVFNESQNYVLQNEQVYWLYKPLGAKDKSKLNEFKLARFNFFNAKTFYIYGTKGKINLDSSGKILYLLP